MHIKYRTCLQQSLNTFGCNVHSWELILRCIMPSSNQLHFYGLLTLCDLKCLFRTSEFNLPSTFWSFTLWCKSIWFLIMDFVIKIVVMELKTTENGWMHVCSCVNEWNCVHLCIIQNITRASTIWLIFHHFKIKINVSICYEYIFVLLHSRTWIKTMVIYLFIILLHSELRNFLPSLQ